MQTFDARNMLFYVSCLFIDIAFLAFYVAVNPFDHFYQCGCWSLGKIFIKVPCFEVVLECPHEHFLIWWDDPYGDLI